MKTGDQPIVLEQSFYTSLDQLWKSITRVDLMRQWFFDNIPEFSPEVGFKTSFSVRSGERDFVHLWQVTEAVRLRRITCDWRYEGYTGAMRVAFDLLEDRGEIRLRVTATVLEDFPEDIPEFRRENCIGGWEYFINGRLKEFLDSG